MGCDRYGIETQNAPQQKAWLFAEKAFQLIQNKRMNDIDKNALKKKIQEQLTDPHFQSLQICQ
jgi:hypothetical protein